VIIFNLNYLC